MFEKDSTDSLFRENTMKWLSLDSICPKQNNVFSKEDKTKLLYLQSFSIKYSPI